MDVRSTPEPFTRVAISRPFDEKMKFEDCVGLSSKDKKMDVSCSSFHAKYIAIESTLPCLERMRVTS